MQTPMIFGTNWSVASWDARRMLEKAKLVFEYVDIELDAAAATWVKHHTNGKLPIVLLDDETLLQSPTREELAHHLGINLSADMLRTTTTAKPIRFEDGYAASV